MSARTYGAPALSAHPRRRGLSSGDAWGPLGLAVLCVVGLIVLWLAAEHVPAIRIKDAQLLRELERLDRPWLESAGNFMLHLLEPLLFTLWGVALVLIALARGRPRVAVAVVAIMCLAPLTAERLKPLLAHPHVQLAVVHIGAASWPSGHSTAALALVLSAVLVAPDRLRPAVAVLGGLFAAVIGFVLLVLGWHMPSDVLGGFLLATFWAALAVAVLRASERLWPSRAQAPPGAEPEVTRERARSAA